MEFALRQEDIEAAIRLYVTHMGLTQDVQEVTFKQLRKGGFGVEATVRLSVPQVGIGATPAIDHTAESVSHIPDVEEAAPHVDIPRGAIEEESESSVDEVVDSAAKSIFGG